MNKVSCIIAAYNEGPRIGGVLDVAVGHPLVDEVIVVNDASKDNTAEAATRPGVRLINLEKNRGKSFAVATGIHVAKNDFLFLLDADLLGLTREGITELIEPVLNGTADVSLTLRKNSLLIYKMIGLDFVSGERVFARKLIQHLHVHIEKLPGFGLEVFLNRDIVKNKYRLRVVYIPTLITPRKHQKSSFFVGMRDDFSMIGQILKVASFWEIIQQNIKMLSQRV